MYDDGLTLQEKEEGRKYILEKLWDNGEIISEYNGAYIYDYYSIKECSYLEEVKDNILEVEELLENSYWRV